MTDGFGGFRLSSTREATFCFAVRPLASHGDAALGSVLPHPFARSACAHVGFLQVLWRPPPVREQADLGTETQPKQRRRHVEERGMCAAAILDYSITFTVC